MLTNQDAATLSAMLMEPDMFPEARQEITRTLFDYYRALLARDPAPIPQVRRIW